MYWFSVLLRSAQPGRGGEEADGIRLAAIAGSAGKTTTKEFAAAILSRRFAVEKTPGNQNSAIGFPMSVVNLPARPSGWSGRWA